MRSKISDEFVSGFSGVFGKYLSEVGFTNASALKLCPVAIFCEPWFAAVDVFDLSEDIKERGLFHALERVEKREGGNGPLEGQEFCELMNFLQEVLFGGMHFRFRVRP